MKTRTQSRICLRSLLCFMHTCRFWRHQSPGQNQNNFFGNLGAGRGSRTPKGRSPADFECDAGFLQVLPLQHFLQLISEVVARFVQFGSVLYGSVAHTLRTLCAHLQTCGSSPSQCNSSQSCGAAHYPLTQSRSEGISALDDESVLVKLSWADSRKAGELLTRSVDHVKIAIGSVIPS